jgi:hypothetical protein
MPKKSEFPRLRVHTRKGKDGQVWTSYYWDGRAAKTKDIPLGNDYGPALERWKEIEQKGSTWRPPRRIAVARREIGKRRRFAETLWDDLPQWGKRMYLNAEKRAAALGSPFLLTVDDLAATISRAGKRCEVSGIEFVEGQGRHPFAPSIDRINSSIGYRADNIRVVCLIVNFALNSWGEEPLFTLAESLLRNGMRNHSGNGQPAEFEAALSP